MTDAPTSASAADTPAAHASGVQGLQELLRYPRLIMWRVHEPIAQLFDLTARVATELPVYRTTLPWGPPFAGRPL